MTLAALHVTKCRLCGQPQAGSEGLCSDCSRALTRAKQGAAALRSPSAGLRRKPRVVDRIVLTTPVTEETSPPPPRRRVALWTAAGVIVVVVALAFIGKPTRPVEPKVAERAPRAVAPMLEPASASEEANANPVAATPPNLVPSAEVPLAPIEPPRARETRPARAAPGKGSAMRPDTDAKAASEAIRPPPTIVPEADPPQQQARANVAPVTANGDDAQALANALEKCSGEKFLAGVICEQKARLSAFQ